MHITASHPQDSGTNRNFGLLSIATVFVPYSICLGDLGESSPQMGMGNRYHTLRHGGRAGQRRGLRPDPKQGTWAGGAPPDCQHHRGTGPQLPDLPTPRDKFASGLQRKGSHFSMQPGQRHKGREGPLQRAVEGSGPCFQPPEGSRDEESPRGSREKPSSRELGSSWLRPGSCLSTPGHARQPHGSNLEVLVWGLGD